MNKACAECKGACCETITLPYISQGDRVDEFLRVRGSIEGASVRIPAPCPQLHDGRCAIHLTKPRICHEYKVGSPACISAIRSQRPRDADRLIRLAKEHQG